MTEFETNLEERLEAIRRQGLFRELRRVDSPQAPRVRIGDICLLNFSSNDYLGLANDPLLKEASIKAIEKFGVGSGASRLICGSLGPHHELEEALAEFKGVEAALTFSSGYACAIGVICTLLEKDDIVIIDKLVHASIVDAARLSGARLRVFAHNDLNELEEILEWAARQDSATARTRKLIITESIFSMDGDRAPLREIVELKEKYGAWLMIDEAHATGVYGKARRGIAELSGAADRIDVQMGTLGKALGAAGGYICGSRRLVELLVNRARSFIFSTAPVPASAAAAAAAVRFVQSEAGAERCASLWQRVSELREEKPGARAGAIVPVIVGDETKAVEAAADLREIGIYIPAIRYPTVARGAARLRVTLTAAHSSEDVARLLTALQSLNLDL